MYMTESYAKAHDSTTMVHRLDASTRLSLLYPIKSAHDGVIFYFFLLHQLKSFVPFFGRIANNLIKGSKRFGC